MQNVTHHKVSLFIRMRAAVRQRRLTFALIAAISAALVMTVISVSIYVFAGFSRYDLSRPGYEKERQEVGRSGTLRTYNTSGEVTQQTIAEFLAEFDQRSRDLNAYGNFRDGSLSDDTLGISQEP